MKIKLKISFLLLLIVTLSMFFVLFPQTKADTSTGLVGWWKFDEGTGTTAGASAGSVTGSIVGSPSWISGKIGSALSFSGSNYVNFGNPAAVNFGTNSFTYSLWVNVSQSLGPYDPPLTKGGYGSSPAGFDMELGSGVWDADLSDETRYVTSTFGNETLNQWVLLTAVADRSTNQFRTYKNGTLVGSASISALGSVTSGQPLLIGSGGGNGFKGSIDDVRIYSRALTSSDVLELYNAASGGADITPPTISLIVSSSVTSAGATITWNTDEPADSQVEFGTALGSYTNPGTLNSSLVTSHSVTLSSLLSATTYHYRVRSKDSSSNLSISSDQTFTTTSAGSPTPNPITPPTPSPSGLPQLGDSTNGVHSWIYFRINSPYIRSMTRGTGYPMSPLPDGQLVCLNATGGHGSGMQVGIYTAGGTISHIDYFCSVGNGLYQDGDVLTLSGGTGGTITLGTITQQQKNMIAGHYDLGASFYDAGMFAANPKIIGSTHRTSSQENNGTVYNDTWYFNNHPEWVLYDVNKTVIYQYGTHSAAPNFTDTYYQDHAMVDIKAMKSSITLDNTDLSNDYTNFGDPGPGVPYTKHAKYIQDSPGHFTQIYSGASEDPSFRASVLSWNARIKSELNAVGHLLIPNLDFYQIISQGDSAATTALNSWDAIITEASMSRLDVFAIAPTKGQQALWLMGLRLHKIADTLNKGIYEMESTCEQRDNSHICMTTTESDISKAHVNWTLAYYLTVKGKHDGIALMPGGDIGDYQYSSGIIWPQQFETANSGSGVTGSNGIGVPCGDAQQVAGVLTSGSVPTSDTSVMTAEGLFYREYSGGAVLTNLSTTDPSTTRTGTSYSKMLPSGNWTWKDLDNNTVAAMRTLGPVVFGSKYYYPDTYHGEVYLKSSSNPADLVCSNGTTPPSPPPSPDVTAPTVSISSPSSGSTISATITVSANATDPTITNQVTSGISLVSVYIDGGLFATSTTGTLSKSLDTTTLTNSTHTFLAVAKDNAGNQATSTAITAVVFNVANSTRYPRSLSLGSLEGISSIPASTNLTAYILSPATGNILETLTNLLPTAGKYTVSFLSTDPQIVDIKIAINGYLSVKLTNIDTTANSSATLSVPQLSAGDFNNDNIINSLDYSLLNSHYNQNFPSADINKDGLVNSLDYAILKNNFGRVGE